MFRGTSHREHFRRLRRESEDNCPAAVTGRSELQAAYRFCDNPNVSPEKILQPHISATTTRAKNQKVVLCAQDTTELDLLRRQIWPTTTSSRGRSAQWPNTPRSVSAFERSIYRRWNSSGSRFVQTLEPRRPTRRRSETLPCREKTQTPCDTH